jgi:hypothetical protein
MSAVADEEIFSPVSYALPIPETDGLRAETITIRFVGVVSLDRTSLDDLEFVEALRLGAPVRVIANGSVSGKGFTHRVSSDGAEIGYYASLRVAEVELGEAA